MSAQYVRLLDARSLSASQSSPREQVVDLGAYRVLEVSVRVLKAGTATDNNTFVVLQHAAVNEDEAFATLSSTQVRVDTTAPATVVFVEVPAFSRFVRWQTGGGSFAGAPVALIDVVAKG